MGFFNDFKAKIFGGFGVNRDSNQPVTETQMVSDPAKATEASLGKPIEGTTTLNAVQTDHYNETQQFIAKPVTSETQTPTQPIESQTPQAGGTSGEKIA